MQCKHILQGKTFHISVDKVNEPQWLGIVNRKDNGIFNASILVINVIVIDLNSGILQTVITLKC